MISRTLSELEAAITALNERVAELSETDDKARKLTLQLGMDTVQMGGALSKRLRQLEQQLAETTVTAPAPVVEHLPEPVAEAEPIAPALAHEVEEAPHIVEMAQPIKTPHMADEAHLAEADHVLEASSLTDMPEAAPFVADEPLTLEAPPSPIFAPEDVAAYPLRAPETTSSELFAPRAATKKARFPIVTLSVVGAGLLAIILAAAWFMLGHSHTPAPAPAAPAPAAEAPPTSTSTPTPTKAAAPKAAPAPAPKVEAKDDTSSDSDRRSSRSGRHHHDGRGSSSRHEKGSGHVLYDITPPAAPASSPAPF